MQDDLFTTISVFVVALMVGGCGASGSTTGAVGGTQNSTSVGQGGNEAGGSTGVSSTATGGAANGSCNKNVTISGCTPGQLTQTGTLSGRYGTYAATVGDKGYFLQVNEWGASSKQSMSYGGDYFFKMTDQQASVSTSGAPAGYPSMFIGANSKHTTANSGLPKRVGDLGKVLTTWNWADNGAASDSNANSFNATYDVWFSTNAGGDPEAGTPTGGFLMVWYYGQGCQPIGAMTEAGRTIDGIPGCWDVWTGTNSGKPVISYKKQGMITSFGYDLNLFIKDALAHFPGYMNNDWYLTNIFTGFEIWKGGINLESTSFCAEVN